MAKKHWITRVIRAPGSFTRQAKKEDMGVQAFASKVLSPNSKASTKTKKRAALAKTLSKMSKARKRKGK